MSDPPVERQPSLERFGVRHPLRVRWAESDMQGIVFNGHYLTYCDVAVTEYWRALGLPYPEGVADAENDLFVVKATVQYRAPARYDDVLELLVRVARIGTSSLSFEILIVRDEEILIEAELVYVNAHPSEKKSRPVPEKLKSAIKEFEGRRNN